MKKTIVFDLGGVLIDWNPRYLYRDMFADEAEMEYFLAEVCSPEWNASTDAEKTFQDAMEELVPSYPHYRDQIQAYYPGWEKMVGGEIRGSVQVLEELKQAGYPLAALSNWSVETFPIVQERYDFLGWFDPLVISGKVGAKKPDQEIFKIFLGLLGRDPGGCAFIDDSLENIQTAARLGFDTIHFSSPESLRRDLQASGLLR